MLASQLLSLIQENYEYACVLTEVDPDVARKAFILRQRLLPYVDKREDEGLEPHITVFYGLEERHLPVVYELLCQKPLFPITVKPCPDFFHNDADVVYFPVESDGLQDLWKSIIYETGVHPDYEPYKPHCTVAFTQKEKWSEVQRLCNRFKASPITFLCTRVLFSTPSGKKIPLYLNPEKTEFFDAMRLP